MEDISISSDYINLDQFLKWAGVIETGGQVKLMLQDGIIKLNGSYVTERRKKVYPGDIVEIDGIGQWKVVAE